MENNRIKYIGKRGRGRSSKIAPFLESGIMATVGITGRFAL